MKRRVLRVVVVVVAVCALTVAAVMTRNATAALPPGNTVEQWNKVAEDTMVASGGFRTRV